MIPESTVALLRLLGAIIVLALVWFFGDRLVAMVKAPEQAKLDAAVGNNAAMKAGSDAQNASIEGLKSDREARVAKSAAAAKTAGDPQYARAKQLEAAKPAGETPLARAANFLNETYGK